MSGILNSMPNLGNAGSSIRDMLFNKKFLIILVLIVIFLGIAFYVYNTYIAPRINPDFVPNKDRRYKRYTNVWHIRFYSK